MATISDVAARAGVSTATVSRALNGKSTVDRDLVARVRKAAEELGYQPNGPARNLRRQEAAVVALIISDVENPFFTAIARGVEDVAHEVGYSVVLCNSDENAEKENRYIDIAIQERVAGVILSPTGTTTSVAKLANRGTAYVAVDRPLPGQDSDVVLVDTRLAARQATTHLIAQGYERVGCITGPTGVRTADDRLAGYRDALKAAKHRSSPRLVRRTEYKAAGAHRAALDLMSSQSHRTRFWSRTARWLSACCKRCRNVASGRVARSAWSPSTTRRGLSWWTHHCRSSPNRRTRSGPWPRGCCWRESPTAPARRPPRPSAPGLIERASSTGPNDRR